LPPIFSFRSFGDPGDQDIQHATQGNQRSEDKIKPSHGVRLGTAFFFMLLPLDILQYIQDNQDNSGCKKNYLEEFYHSCFITGKLNISGQCASSLSISAIMPPEIEIKFPE
jgi:hypothetical protein